MFVVALLYCYESSGVLFLAKYFWERQLCELFSKTKRVLRFSKDRCFYFSVSFWRPQSTSNVNFLEVDLFRTGLRVRKVILDALFKQLGDGRPQSMESHCQAQRGHTSMHTEIHKLILLVYSLPLNKWIALWKIVSFTFIGALIKLFGKHYHRRKKRSKIPHSVSFIRC